MEKKRQIFVSRRTSFHHVFEHFFFFTFFLFILERSFFWRMHILVTSSAHKRLTACAVGDATPFKHGLARVFEAPQSGDYQENRFGVLFRMFVMGMIDDRHGLT